MPSIGGPELFIILMIVLLVFGAGKLPEVGSALGKGIREFRAATTDPPRETPEDSPAPGAGHRPTASRCPACGQERPAGDRFCGGCGATLPGPA